MNSDICGLKKLIYKERNEFLRYFVCSLFALILDIGTFSISIRFLGLHWVYAVCIGFLVGSIVSYLGSIFWVFHSRDMATHQGTEFSLFIIIGICGLGLCEFLVWVGMKVLGLPAELTRFFASIVTFFFNFVIRKIVLFRD